MTTTALIDLSGIRVLVADDSADNRFLIELYLKKSGAKPEMAENGQEAIDKALAGNFDIVLMDIQMPLLDGNMAMKSLMAAGYGTPVIALTAHSLDEERKKALESGFHEYLTKPIKRDLLLNTIKKLVHKV